jgi:phytoene dehydrogenase-like protein
MNEHTTARTGNHYDTLIVGGGIAGLTSAVYLARAGQKVLLIEKNRECGGLVNTFSRDGFRFDAGVRALEDAGIIFPMLNDLGISLEVVKSPVSVGIGNEMLNIIDQNSIQDYRDLLVRLYPDNEGEVDAVIRAIRKVMKYMEVLYGIENPVFKDLKHDRAFLFKKILPWLPKFLMTVGKINRMSQPVEQYLDTIVSNPSLRDIIAQHFFRDTPTFFALSYFSLYLDYFYPTGGVGKLAEALEEKITAFGGEIKGMTRAVEVRAAGQQVIDDQGNTYGYGNLIWAGDLKTLYSSTRTEGLPPETRTRFEETKSRMLAARGGDSVFSIFLEVDEPPESFRKIANGHFFYTPSKKGLGETHREELDRLLADWENVDKAALMAWLDRFVGLNTFEISIPSLKDPSMSPAGKTGVIVSFLAEHELFSKVRADGWYDAFKTALEDRVLKVLSDSIYPMLKDKVIARFSFSPLSIENRTGSSEGAIVGWSFHSPVPVVNKIQVADRSVLTPLPGVYQAGQWAYSPAGVPMSILTGKLAADKVMKKKKG